MAFLARLLSDAQNNGSPGFRREPILQAAYSVLLSGSLLAGLCGACGLVGFDLHFFFNLSSYISTCCLFLAVKFCPF